MNFRSLEGEEKMKNVRYGWFRKLKISLIVSVIWKQNTLRSRVMD